MSIVEIITGVAGSGKSAWCRDRLVATPGAWLVLPLEELCTRWRDERAPPATVIQTAQALAGEIAAPLLGGWEVATPALRLLILRQIIRDKVQSGEYFGKVAHTAGFAHTLGDLIRQLRQNEADVDQLAAAVSAAAPHAADGAFDRKGHEIVALYRAYAAYLQEHRLLDGEDVLRLAVRRIREAPERVPWPPAVIVDGFFAFTRLQLSFLQALAGQVERLAVTLTYAADREALFASTGETLRRLRERFPGAVEVALPAADQRAAAPSLRVLERRLFAAPECVAGPPAGEPAEGGPGRGILPAGTREGPTSGDGTVAIFAAPDEMMQVEIVAREIRRLVDREGYQPREICLLTRAVAEVAPVLKPVFARYDIPVWLYAGERLGDNPFVRCVSSLLRLWRRNWRREDLLRFAGSSYAGFNRFAVDAMERKARRLGIQQGRARWLTVFAPPEAESDLATALRALAAWQDRLGEARSAREYGGALEEALTELGLAERMRRGEPPLVSADVSAWNGALNVLEDLSRLAEHRPWHFADFAETALAGWAEGFYNRPPDDADRVQVREVYDARGHTFRAVFVLGLVEGAFPRRPHEDPCFRDDERALLALHGGLALPLSITQADEERLLFYQAITAPRERLVLCHPRTDRDGGVTLRSFFLDAVEQALPRGVLTVKAPGLDDFIPDPTEAVLPRERLAYLAAAIGEGQRPDAEDAPERLRRLCETLREEQPVELQRLLAASDERRPYHVSHPAVRGHWAARRGTYTVSELERARACRFQHYLGYRLRLRGTVPGAGPLDQGNILHKVLEQFFRETLATGFPAPEVARARLHALCRELFAATPMDAQPYRIRLAERAVLRYLDGFVERELRYRDASLLAPAYLEFAFGPQAGLEEEEETGDEEPRGPADPGSLAQPLVIRDGQEAVRLSGKIDRIDCTPDGRHAMILDYKLGKAQTLKAIQEGESLQLPVYWLAVEQLLGLTPAGGAYDALRERARPVIGRSDLVGNTFSDPAILGRNVLVKTTFDQVLERARATVVETVALIERLEIAPNPVEPRTCQFCRYQDCCRPEEAHVRFDHEPAGGSADE